MHRDRGLHGRLLCGTAAIALLLATGAHAEEAKFNIAAQPLADGLNEFAKQSGRPVMFTPEVAGAKMTHGVSGATDPEKALNLVLADTGLTWRKSGDTYLIVSASDPQSGSAAGDGADGTVQALIVTAQKREEDIQDVPIAMSAFTQEDLTRSQVAGGPDLMTQVPNMTFTKTNFTSYSIQLRGIGTQAISATVDAAVAVAFNNTPFIRNRFFEQEFYDLQRVEVLRGPQGTLYGRNATAGVVNLISQKPKLATYEAKISADVANYSSSRIEGMLNIPLAEDVAALRIAGAWTKREGYATNQLSGNPIDGRDLWSTRVSLRFAPNDRLDANLIWEHFEENDDRIRSGKQLCKTDVVNELTAIFPDGSVVVHPIDGINTTMRDWGQLSPNTGAGAWAGVQGTFSQGCAPASLYSPDSFGTPNGSSAPYYGPLRGVGLPTALADPYASRTQSHDLRVIESALDPEYRAKADVVELQVGFDLTDSLTLTSETGYSSDFIFSQQDYNRFNSAPGAFDPSSFDAEERGVLDENGVFCDPQIGCSDRLVAMDVSTAKSRHFSQEFRIGSSYAGPFNFSLGANFLRYDTEDKYYVFINTLSMYAALHSGNGQLLYQPGVTDNRECLPFGATPPDVNGSGLLTSCVYIDPNPISSLNDQGRNYFLSRNPYKLISYAVFGETYYQITDNLKLTAGLRWTVDKKEAPRIPSWLIAGDTIGQPVAEVVEQEWREPTGRLALDWKPDLAFTDETMIYASYAHGYKAGGMNPPAAALVCYGGCGDYVDEWQARSAIKPKTFDAEYVDALELGSKNTLLDGRLTLNLASFYYDYQGYQLSQIVDRAAITQNYDATVWGIEVEADWRPLENLRLGFKGGYEQTKVADGMRAIDVMDRTAGTPGWVVVSPFPTFPSNCVLPAFLYSTVEDGNWDGPPGQISLHGVGGPSGGHAGGCELAYLFRVDPVTELTYVANPTVDSIGGGSLSLHPGYVGWNPTLDYGNNNGEGFFKDLSGNELPNAPHFTATVTADYTIPLANDWLATLHTDLYYQSEAWTRIFNTPGYDKLKAYTNVNLAAIFSNDDLGWKVMAYVKNVFDRDSITGAFLNSDDTGLTTNVFLTEPRLYGLRVTKDFTGGPWWTGANLRHEGPYPLTVEIGGQVQRQDAPYQTIQSGAFANLSETLQTPLSAIQNRDFDWGDGRSLRLTYQPDGSRWKVSAAIRYGRTNNDLDRAHAEDFDPPFKACAFNPGSFYAILCDPTFPKYVQRLSSIEFPTYSDATSRDREEHSIVDFDVGYDVGIGALSAASSLHVGLRKANFDSTSVVTGRARAGFSATDGWSGIGGGGQTPFFINQYDFKFAAQREFEGWGPTLGLDASIHLLGNESTGILALETSLTGGILFGRQETSASGEDIFQLTRGYYDNGGCASASGECGFPFVPSGPATISDLPASRSNDVTVPLADVSLGLSYDVGRIKVGTGYRWERYFNVLDVGYDEHRDADRTIDGPYFKIAVGFGG